MEYKVRFAVHLNFKEESLLVIPHTGNIPKHCANRSIKEKQALVDENFEFIFHYSQDRYWSILEYTEIRSY